MLASTIPTLPGGPSAFSPATNRSAATVPTLSGILFTGSQHRTCRIALVRSAAGIPWRSHSASTAGGGSMHTALLTVVEPPTQIPCRTCSRKSVASWSAPAL